jgi:cation diffusion facilitator CzcD-associated flavoprotein CzcO
MTLDTEVVIVGTGFGGQCAAIQLKQAGFNSILLLERGHNVGGTWRDNDYPGAACDIPSHLYSFSFDLNPDWSRKFPDQRELYAYLRRTAEHHGLMPHIRFGTRLLGASFNSTHSAWTLQTSGGVVHTRYLVLATGALSEPMLPELPGLGRFGGKVFHSAQWDHGYRLEGKHVAVIGTGASAIQFVPQIAGLAAKLTVFQRTPPWIMPRRDHQLGAWRRTVFRKLPVLMRLHRWGLYWEHELRALGSVLGPGFLKLPTRLALAHLRNQVRDEGLRKRLTPAYVIGCKRVLISDDWYPALQRANVHVETAAVREVVVDGIRTSAGQRVPCDAIIFGTGFQATEFFGHMAITGRFGVSLKDAWRDGAQAYLGAAVAGFPNLFLVTGPNTGLGHNSMVFMIEANVRQIVAALTHARQTGQHEIEVKREVQADYNEELQRRLQRSVWATGCKSWYQDRNGMITTMWPGFSTQYWARARRLAADHFVFA